MKSHILAIGAFIFLFTQSCKRCTDCTCSQEISFEFVGYTTAQEDAIKEAWTTGFAEDYPDEDVEVCDTRGKKFKEAVQDYRDKSDYKTETYGNNTYGYTYEWYRTCSCEYDK